MPTPRGPGQQPGVRRPAAGGSGEEGVLGGLLPVEDGGLARVWRAGAGGRPRRASLIASDRRGDAGRDLLGRSVGGDDAAAAGELGGEREEAGAQPGLEVGAEALEAVLRPAAGEAAARGR